MSTSGLSPPGSATYDSSTLYVGDGTWDSQRNDFLLPNLQSLNYDTMRYNGMGNRFSGLAGYSNIILGHGVVAAITFLGIVPAAILIARFYHRNPRHALRMHIWLQILTLLLTTVVFILGYFAVGPPRSLTNPHHGIGLAIFVLVVVQAFAGGIIHHTEKGKGRNKIPLRLMLHQWMGRAIALLGIAQVALGLTLYGSPIYLFILYALWVFALLVAYFVFEYLNQPVIAYDGRGSYVSGTQSEIGQERAEGRRGLGALLGAGTAGAGIASLIRRRRSQSQGLDSRRDERQSGTSGPRRPSRPPSQSYLDEKYTDDGSRDEYTWKEKLFGGAAGLGGIAAIRSWFNRRRGRDGDSDTGSYRDPLGGVHNISQRNVSRVEEGRGPVSQDERWRETERREAAQATGNRFDPAATGAAPQPRKSAETVTSYESRTSVSRGNQDTRREGGRNLRDGLATLGALGLIKETWRKRRERKEQRRIEEMRQREKETERLHRADSLRDHQNAASNSFPRRGGRRGSLTQSTLLIGSPHDGNDGRQQYAPGVEAIPTAAVPMGSRSNVALHSHPPETGAWPPPHTALIAPLPPPHHSRTDLAATAAAAGLPAAGLAAAREGSRDRRGSGNTSSPPTAGAISAASPVSVKVKLHDDGRHVTLRRLNEQEAAAEHEARRRDRGGGRGNGRRSSSLASGGGMDDSRWRRVEELEAQQAAQAQQRPPAVYTSPGRESRYSGPGQTRLALPPPLAPGHSTTATVTDPAIVQHLPPPPRVSTVAGTQVSSPGTGTDLSNYDSNRRRRRAERAQARAAAARESFEGIHLDLSKLPGRCRIAEAGIAWKPQTGGETFTLDSKSITHGQWSRAARGYELKVTTSMGGLHQLDGFEQEDFDRVTAAFKRWYTINLEHKEHSLRGWNWGKAEFGKYELAFNVQSRPAFEIAYTEIQNTNLAGKNEVAVELAMPAHDDDTGTNGHLGGARAKGKKSGGARDELVEMRFYIPGTVTKREKKEDGEEVTDGEDGEEQNAANTFYDTLMDKAEIGEVAGDTYATFLDILHLTPRGRFDIAMYEKSFRLRGKTYDYKIQYDSIKKLMVLPKPDELHVLIAVGLDPPLRQGQTRYPFAVMQVKRDEEVAIELNMAEDLLKEKYNGKLEQHYEAPIHQVIVQLFRGLAGKKVTTPSKDFLSHNQQSGVKCSIKANEGHLFCLDKSFMFVPKPATYIAFDNIQSITMSRVAGAVGAASLARTFDITITLKSGQGEQQFSNINREEQQPLEDFFRAKNIRTKNDMADDGGALLKAALQNEESSSEDEVVAGARGSADEDDESVDEDFKEESDTDVAEEFDSAHESSGSGSDAEMGDADADADGGGNKHTAAKVERPKKKPKTEK